MKRKRRWQRKQVGSISVTYGKGPVSEDLVADKIEQMILDPAFIDRLRHQLMIADAAARRDRMTPHA